MPLSACCVWHTFWCADINVHFWFLSSSVLLVGCRSTAWSWLFVSVFAAYLEAKPYEAESVATTANFWHIIESYWIQIAKSANTLRSSWFSLPKLAKRNFAPGWFPHSKQKSVACSYDLFTHFTPLSPFVSLWNWSGGLERASFLGNKWRVRKMYIRHTHCHHLSSRTAVKVYHLELVSRDAKARSDSSMSRLYECDRSSRNTCFSRRRSLRSEGFPFHFGVRVEQCACCGHVKG